MNWDLSDLQVFSEIYEQRPRIIKLGELEVKLGSTGTRLRPSLEKLKELGFIIENEGCFEISAKGITEARGMWA